MTFSGLLQAPTTFSKERTHVRIDCEAVRLPQCGLRALIVHLCACLLAVRCVDLEFCGWVGVDIPHRQGLKRSSVWETCISNGTAECWAHV
jgi:hypothetical protein